MKVAHAEKHVLGSHGLTETRAFQIRTNAHAFKLLSSGLYSDKISAVLREIGCNAVDAHIEQGTPDVPIIVKLPNRIDNQFYIRDMGPGLSHDDVMNLYTTYFGSTKQESNAYTGAFGLGSKSPFSYTDSFTIVSVHDGIKRTYSAYLDNMGAPTIAKLTETKADSEHPHGVQIGFPVKPEDFATFENRAQQIYRWFRIKPKIEGARAIQEHVARYVHPLFEFHPGNTNGKPWTVLMGNVIYPLDLNKLGTLFSPANFASRFNGIVLKLNIGDVQVAASREELQYDPDTVKLIKEKIALVIRVIGDDMSTKLRVATTWDEKCAARGATQMWGADLYRSSWVDFFTGLKYPDAQTLAGLATNEYVQAPICMGTHSIAKIITMGGYKGRSVDHNRVKDGHFVDKYQQSHVAQIKLKPRTKIYYGEKMLSLVRIKSEFDQGKVEQILLFTIDKPDGKTALHAKLDAEATAQALGIKTVQDINTVPMPATYVPAQKKKYTKKGLVLPPMPTHDVKAKMISGANSSYNIATLTKPSWHNFMVRTSKTGWSRTDQIRVFEKTAETDYKMDVDDWDAIWGAAKSLASCIKAPFEAYVELPAMDAKKLDLIKRGWKTTYVLIKEWLEQATTRDDIIRAASNWMPSMELVEHHNADWAGELVWVLNSKPDVFKDIKPILARHDILRPIEQIHQASVKHGSSAGLTEPKVLTAYKHLAATYKLQPITVNKAGGYITVEDFNTAIKTKFPLTQTFAYGTFRQVYDEHPHKAEGFLKLILS